jgi:hypothetical protein
LLSQLAPQIVSAFDAPRGQAAANLGAFGNGDAPPGGLRGHGLTQRGVNLVGSCQRAFGINRAVNRANRLLNEFAHDVCWIGMFGTRALSIAVSRLAIDGGWVSGYVAQALL